MKKNGPVQYSPRRQSRWVLADYGGKICGKGEFWAWNETVNEWWRVRVVSRWEVESRFQILLFIRKLKWPNTSTTWMNIKRVFGWYFRVSKPNSAIPKYAVVYFRLVDEINKTLRLCTTWRTGVRCRAAEHTVDTCPVWRFCDPHVRTEKNTTTTRTLDQSSTPLDVGAPYTEH